MTERTSDFSSLRFANAFASPFLTHIWQNAAEVNSTLRKTILAHEATRPDTATSNPSEWYSGTGQLEFCGEAGQRLLNYAAALANEATTRVLASFKQKPSAIRWTVEAWANVNRSGASNKMHVHPESTWSGIYYVDTGDAGDPDNGAALQLRDPYPARNATFLRVPDSVYIKPKAGLMVLFPSYVPHMVFPHRGEDPRISIAFNLRKEPLPSGVPRQSGD